MSSTGRQPSDQPETPTIQLYEPKVKPNLYIQPLFQSPSWSGIIEAMNVPEGMSSPPTPSVSIISQFLNKESPMSDQPNTTTSTTTVNRSTVNISPTNSMGLPLNLPPPDTIVKISKLTADNIPQGPIHTIPNGYDNQR
jgi:hypothetical protein